eukprot:8148792-Pyramimonas_sp.AAC.1
MQCRKNAGEVIHLLESGSQLNVKGGAKCWVLRFQAEFDKCSVLPPSQWVETFRYHKNTKDELTSLAAGPKGKQRELFAWMLDKVAE